MLQTGQGVVRRRNDFWQHGQGRFYITAVNGRTILLSESGQRRRDYQTEVRYHWLAAASGKMETFEYQKELARLGREIGYTYLVNEDRTLVMETPPLGGAADSPRELWVRHPDGRYARLAVGVNYMGCVDGEVRWWDPADRRHHFYKLSTGEVRSLGGYHPDLEMAGGEEKTIDLRAAPDGSSLELGKKVGGVWQYTTVLSVEKFLAYL